MDINYENDERVVASGELSYRAYSQSDRRIRLDFYKGDYLFFAISFPESGFVSFVADLLKAVGKL